MIKELGMTRSKSAGQGVSSSKSFEKGISKLAMEQNSKMIKLINTPVLSGMRPINYSLIHSNLSQTSQFSNLLHKIEEITERPRCIFQNSTAKEGQNYEHKLNKNEKLVISIKVLDKLCPLKVTIVKTGKLIIYASSKATEPDKDNSERTFKTDKFLIYDTKFRFKISMIHLGILAQEISEFKIFFSFHNEEKKEKINRHKQSSLRAKTAIDIQRMQDNLNLKEKFRNYVDELIVNRKKRNYLNAGCKNYVKINLKKIGTGESPKCVRSKSEKRFLKSQEVAEKRKVYYEEKLLRAKQYINKKELKLHEDKEKRLEMQKVLEKQHRIGRWHTIIFIISTSEKLFFKFKQLKMDKIKANILAARIQRIYRRWNTFIFDNLSKELIRSRNTLLLFHLLAKPFILFTRYKLIQHIKKRISLQKPKIVVKRYMKKILFVQNFFKETFNIRTLLFEKYQKIWKMRLAIVIKKIMKKKELNKANKLMGIKDNVRDQLLNKLLRGKLEVRRARIDNLQLFRPSREEISELIRKACEITE